MQHDYQKAKMISDWFWDQKQSQMIIFGSTIEEMTEEKRIINNLAEQGRYMSSAFPHREKLCMVKQGR